MSDGTEIILSIIFLAIFLFLLDTFFWRSHRNMMNRRLEKPEGKRLFFIGSYLTQMTYGKGGLILHWIILAIIYERIFYIILLDTPLLAFGSLVAIILASLDTYFNFKLIKELYQEQGETLGKARFASSKEIFNSKLFAKSGLVFGKHKGKIISKSEGTEGHALIVGGTGTGKTRGVVLPTLFNWQGSILAIDIKGELDHITSSYRSQHEQSTVYIFNPQNSDCSRYDPIANLKTIADAQELARTLIPTAEGTDPFWSQSAQSLLSAACWEGKKNNTSITEIARTLCTTDIEELISHYQHHPDPDIKVMASVVYGLQEKTLSGVIGQLKSALMTLATDPDIAKATSGSDWTPESLEFADIYLQVSEHMLEQYRDLWTVIISQILRHLAQREEGKNPAVLLALDEMPRLGKLEGLTSALATLRSRNVHLLLIIQSMAQLDSIYGQNDRKVIADNCRFKFVLSATDPETQKYFSDLAGQKTIKTKSFSDSLTSISVGASEQGTPLIRPEEFANLAKPILFAPFMQPIQLDYYYYDQNIRELTNNFYPAGYFKR